MGLSALQAQHNEAQRTIEGLRNARQQGGVQMMSFIWHRWSRLDQAAAVATWRLAVVEHNARAQLAQAEARGLEIETNLSREWRQERRVRALEAMNQVMKRWRAQDLLRAATGWRAGLAADRAAMLMAESEQVTDIFAQEARSALPPRGGGGRVSCAAVSVL